MEGIHDIQFLMRLSRRLAEGDPTLPNLNELVSDGRLVVLPMGGDLAGWSDRLMALGCPQFHLYDRESEPETSQRRRLAAQVNLLNRCHAVVMTKRSLENYLHPTAIAVAGGGAICFGDDDCVASVVAEDWYARVPRDCSWSQLARRSRCRMVNRVKRWLNTRAIEQMTPQLLAERDPHGELLGWLTQIGAMVADVVSRSSALAML